MNFLESIDKSKSTGGTEQTIKLTMQCNEEAAKLISRMQANEWPGELMIATMHDHDKMDAFLAENAPFNDEDYAWLSEIESGLVDRMIKSQQSKRSRSKGKQLTLQAVTALIVGAFAENALRKYCNKPKNQLVSMGAEVNFTEEQLAELKENQEDLKRHIRNLQSRASIMKSKAAFDENDPKYVSLLHWQERLKALRDGTTAASRANPAVVELLKDKDLTNMKPAEAKELLAKIQELSQL